jgi:hypothetical protein
MADAKISALTAVSTPLGTDEIPVNQGGTTKKVTVSVLGQYAGMGGIYNASTGSQGPGFATDTYLTGSNLLLPAGLQQKSIYRCIFNVSKTAAGAAVPTVTVRVGTAGAIGDTSRVALTFATQTAIADEGMIEIWCGFRAVGASASFQAIGRLTHSLASTGFSNVPASIKSTLSSAFDSTIANTQIGLSVNGNTSAAWTVNLVQAEFRNVA